MAGNFEIGEVLADFIDSRTGSTTRFPSRNFHSVVDATKILLGPIRIHAGIHLLSRDAFLVQDSVGVAATNCCSSFGGRPDGSSTPEPNRSKQSTGAAQVPLGTLMAFQDLKVSLVSRPSPRKGLCSLCSDRWESPPRQLCSSKPQTSHCHSSSTFEDPGSSSNGMFRGSSFLALPPLLLPLLVDFDCIPEVDLKGHSHIMIAYDALFY